MKAVFLDFLTLGPGLNIDGLKTLLPELEIFDITTDEQVPERIKDANIILTNKIDLDEKLLSNCPSLQVIGLTATGTDNVDLEAAKNHGVAVCNIRAYCTQSIAEHVFACLLNFTRNLQNYNTAVRAGHWEKSENFCLMSFPIRELSEMKIGIVGYGELGRGVANLARSFGMEVMISVRPGTLEIKNNRVLFEDILKFADVISLHCPLTDSTKGMFSEAEFKKMKSDAILINTARGGLVDPDALVEALNSGEIAAAAIDVLSKEPPVDGNPLLDYDKPNLILTPHIGWGSKRARQAAIDQLTENIAAFIRGERLNQVVTRKEL
ncbi:MAG: glycerate dehydrogenase [Gammaproteobacteria bacterium]|nr:glycerate dehydrogenase [Gammaproteobacteria bacterium]|tara:strand:- start:10178 stop:11146 length:969 start_codon:yes stop_codon:yes gene_type:complete